MSPRRGSQLLTLEGPGLGAAVALSDDGRWILPAPTEPAADGAAELWCAKLWDGQTGWCAASQGTPRK